MCGRAALPCRNNHTVMGRYVDRNLVKDERVVHETTYHWVTFVSWRAVFTLFLAPLIDVLADEFAITNKRVMIKTGLITIRTFEVNHSKIESVHVDQGLLGRILGYGTITIVGSGGTRLVVERIRRPVLFRKKFHEWSV